MLKIPTPDIDVGRKKRISYPATFGSDRGLRGIFTERKFVKRAIRERDFNEFARGGQKLRKNNPLVVGRPRHPIWPRIKNFEQPRSAAGKREGIYGELLLAPPTHVRQLLAIVRESRVPFGAAFGQVRNRPGLQGVERK